MIGRLDLEALDHARLLQIMREAWQNSRAFRFTELGRAYQARAYAAQTEINHRLKGKRPPHFSNKGLRI
jgi:hypothetical protein